MALLPISVYAAGLGKLNVMSGLGDPLKADIELISVTAEELNSISASIASQDAYATQGIEKPASHNSIKVSIAKNAAGAPVLKLNSTEPISEPFLDMLIQVDWSSGRLLREYTVLLDPPGYTGEANSGAQTAQAPIVSSNGQKKTQQNTAITASQNDQMTAAPAVSAKPGTKKSTKHKKAMPVENTGDTETAVTEAASGTDYTTQRGDTLLKIARETKPDGVSLEQMLVGLYQANPKAFQGSNMNRLKVGQIIRQPSQETLNAISRGEAQKEIKVQTANWNAYRNKLAGMVAESTPADSETNTKSAGGKIKSAAEDKSTPAATGSKDVVKLSAGDAAVGKGDSANIKTLQDKITSLQEEAVAREKSVKEAESRSADLEKQIADMQKLLALKNGMMSDLQKKAEAAAAKKADAEKPAPVEVAKPAEVPKPAEVTKPAEIAKPEAPAAEPAKPAEVPKPAELAKPEAPVAEPAKPEAAKPAVKPVPVPAPVEEPGFLAGMMNSLDLGLLAPLGGVLALLGGGWVYLRKKREKSLADFEQGIMTSGGLKANTVFGNTASASVDTGDTSFLTDFSQSGSSGMIDTNDVDPIAEAEVYMAYGRDAQAEEILKDAIAKEPKRHELHLKLLEMYAASKNLSAFETVAGELYTSLGAADPTWAKVAEIGIKLEPNNPLYQGNSQPTGSLDANDFADSPLAAEKDLDFSFDNDALTKGFAPTGVAATAAAGLTAAAVVVEDVSAKKSFDLGLGGLDDAPIAPAETNFADLEMFATSTQADADLEMFATSKLEDADLAQESVALDISGVDDGAMEFDISNVVNDGAMEFDMSGFGDIGLPLEADTIQTAAVEFELPMPSEEVASESLLISSEDMASESMPSESMASLDMPSLDISSDDMPNLDMPSLDVPSENMPSLDVPTFTAPQFMPEIEIEEATAGEVNVEEVKVEELNVPEAEMLESFEFPTETTESILDVSEMDAHFANATISDESEFNFDIPTTPTEPEPEPETDSLNNADFSDANSFDLSTISLDMNEGLADQEIETPQDFTPAADEPIEIETKLDLVVAYIEMDDKEGAKELLDEVMKEGGATQRKRAEALLAKLA